MHALPPLKASMMMRRLMTMLAAATLALGLLEATAEAHGSRRPGSQIRLGGYPSPSGSGRHHHIRHQLSPGYGVQTSYQPNCYFPEELPKLPPWPPFCNSR
jgi:hypothetical protein